MHRYKWILYSLTLFLGLNVLLVSDLALAVDCRGQTIVPNTHGSHFYTCEYPESSDRLISYCNKDNTLSNTGVGGDCPAGLVCHICECPSGIRTDGRCESAPEPTIVVNNTGEETTVLGETYDGGSENNNEEQQNQEEEPCPGGILDSQGKCCKKTYYDLNLKATVCCEGILLSTNVPFIGQCIVYRKASDPQQPAAGLVVDENTAFPVLMGGLSKILVSIILLVSFVGILIGGVMISASGGSDEGARKGRKIIGNVISALALLGASGVILKLINPNFFG